MIEAGTGPAASSNSGSRRRLLTGCDNRGERHSAVASRAKAPTLPPPTNLVPSAGPRRLGIARRPLAPAEAEPFTSSTTDLQVVRRRRLARCRADARMSREPGHAERVAGAACFADGSSHQSLAPTRARSREACRRRSFVSRSARSRHPEGGRLPGEPRFSRLPGGAPPTCQLDTISETAKQAFAVVQFSPKVMNPW
jgi:hypothetical protein